MEAPVTRRPYVLLLRPPGSQAGKLAEIAIVANIPVIDLELVPGALERVRQVLRHSDWLVLTSPRAPRLLAPLVDEIRRLQGSGKLRIAAVGPKTREAVEELGLRVDYVPREYRGAALAEELAEFKPRRVLLPRSEKAVPDLVERLRAYGIEAVEIPLYRVVTLDDMAEAAARIADFFDYVVFTSPSIAEAFTRHYPRPHSPGFTPIAIGPTTARRLRSLGYPEALQPKVYTLDAVAELVARLHGGRDTGPV